MKLIIAGPSGVGKSSLINKLLEVKGRVLSKSYTTRPPRAKELEGEEYHFISKEDFISLREKGDFFETEEVYGNYYGSHKRYFNEEHITIFNVDIKGALNIKRHYPNSVTIFLLPPSIEELKNRLINRGDENISHRLDKALNEINDKKHFDYILINNDFYRTLKRIENIIDLYIHSLEGLHKEYY